MTSFQCFIHNQKYFSKIQNFEKYTLNEQNFKKSEKKASFFMLPRQIIFLAIQTLHWHPRNGFWKDFQNALLFIGILASSLWLLCWSEFPSHHQLSAKKINFDLYILGWIYWWYLFALLRFTCASFTSHWTNARYVHCTCPFIQILYRF